MNLSDTEMITDFLKLFDDTGREVTQAINAGFYNQVTEEMTEALVLLLADFMAAVGSTQPFPDYRIQQLCVSLLMLGALKELGDAQTKQH
jgi:hypothetical protein